MTARPFARLACLALALATGSFAAAQPKEPDDPRDEPEVGAFVHILPDELRFGDFGINQGAADTYAERLAGRDPDARLAAARSLWRGHSRRHAADVLKFLAEPPPGGDAFRAFRRQVGADLQPKAIRHELTRGDYAWGAWLAFLRPHKDLVPVLLKGLKDKKDDRGATLIALGNSADPRAFDALVQWAANEDHEAAGFAAAGLGYFGDARAEPVLVSALDADDPWILVNAADALGRVGTPKALAALEPIADGKKPGGVYDVARVGRAAIVRIERRFLPPDPARWPAGPERTPAFVLRGHPSHIWALAFSPNGKALASVGDDRAVRLWDPAAGKATAAFAGHAEQMVEVAFVGPDTLATVGWSDKSVRLLDARSGRETKELAAGGDSVDSLVVVAPDGRRVAVGTYKADGPSAVLVFDVATGKTVLALPQASRALAFRPDGKVLATLSNTDPNNLQLWDLASGKVVSTLDGPARGLAAFTPDGKTLVTAGGWTVRVWDLATGKQTASFRGDSGIRTLTLSPDGRYAVAGEEESPLRVWDLKERKAAAVLTARGPVAFSPDGKTLATAAADGPAILLWALSDLAGGRR